MSFWKIHKKSESLYLSSHGHARPPCLKNNKQQAQEEGKTGEHLKIGHGSQTLNLDHKSAEMVKETDLLWDNLIIKEEEWKMQASEPNEKIKLRSAEEVASTPPHLIILLYNIGYVITHLSEI